MRCLFEVIATGIDIARFPNRRTGGVDEVAYCWISGLDSDYQDQMIKLKIFRPKNLEALKTLAQKGNRLTVKFRTLKHDEKFERCTVITVNEEDIQSHAQAAVQPVPVAQTFVQPVQSEQPAQSSQGGNGVQPAPMALAA